MKLIFLVPVWMAIQSANAASDDARHVPGEIWFGPRFGPRCANETHPVVGGTGTAPAVPTTYSKPYTATANGTIAAGIAASTGGALSYSSSTAPFGNATTSDGALGQSLISTGTVPIATGVLPTAPAYGSQIQNTATNAPLSTGGTGTGTGFPASSLGSSAPFGNATHTTKHRPLRTGTGTAGIVIPLSTGGTGTGTGVFPFPTGSAAPFQNATSADPVSTARPLSTGGTGTRGTGTRGTGTGIVPSASEAALSQSSAPFFNHTSTPNYGPATSQDVTTTIRLTETVSSTVFVAATSIPTSTGTAGTASESNGALSQSSVPFANASMIAASTIEQLPSTVAEPTTTSESTSLAFGPPPTYGYTPSASSTSAIATTSDGALSQSSLPQTAGTSRSADPESSASAPSASTTIVVETVLPAPSVTPNVTSSVATSFSSSSFVTSTIPATTIDNPATTTQVLAPSYLPPPPPPTYLERRDMQVEPSALPYRDPAPGFRKPAGESGVLQFTNWLFTRREGGSGSWLPNVRGAQGVL